MSQAIKIYGGITVAEVIFGVWPVVASLAIKEGFDPFVFVFYRCAGSATLLVALSVTFEGQAPWGLLLPDRSGLLKGAAWKDLPWKEFLLLGGLLAANYLGYIIGVSCTSSTQAALMQPLIPVLACLSGLVSGTETVNAGKIMGIMTSVGGAMYMVYAGQREAVHRGQHAGLRYELGTLALMVGVISTAFYFVLQKALLRRYKPIFITSVTMVVATCYLMIVVFFYAEEFRLSTWRPWILTPRREAALAYAIIFTTTVNLLILSWANKVTNPSTTTAFSTLQPVIALIAGAIIFGTVPNQRTITGGVAILCGLGLTVRAQLAEASDRSLEDTPLL
jgi:drug/metabolite transporter (DMT)-like permease